ncbi:MAG TPA: hypothetical protein VG318_02440 [Actinomycetota bacterium]|nr:hypothetical protein [Actinomycetota bacterium]
MKKATFALAAGVAAIAGLTMGQSLAGPPAPPPALSCGPGEMIGYFHQDVSALDGGGSVSPRHALAAFLTEELPGLSNAPFDEGPGGESAQGFAYAQGADHKMLVATIRLGNGWHVDGFSACDETVVDAKGGN